MARMGNRTNGEQITAEEGEQAEALRRDIVEPYLKQHFPFVDLDHPRVYIPRRARSRPQQSIITDLPVEKPALFCFTYASPPESPSQRVVQVFVEATSQESKIVHVAASK
jgi:hypothetical protein